MLQQLAGLTADCGAFRVLSMGLLTEATDISLQQAPGAPWQQAIQTLPGKLLKVLLCH